LCLLLMASIIAGAALGAIPIEGSDMYYGLRNGILHHEQGNIAQQVFFSLRFPRVLLSAITGGSLAVSGLIMQAITRNPIVE
ncbi:iron chelate uptake ABC transporter family permease subunit, partial [Escherichia coli]|uniref:iron chelate uptake ABC transporter family permease subunit n=1 Tax=Escherichia coli TaxID=562 RepID=UPI0039E087D0